MECLFCKIIKGEIPSYTVYEDEIVKVFLDVNPASVGHSLIVPKEHYTNVNDIDINTLTHINEVVKKLYPTYQEKLNCDGLTLIQNNDYGQEVKHYHLHMIPRYDNDNIHLDHKEVTTDIEEVYNKLK